MHYPPEKSYEGHNPLVPTLADGVKDFDPWEAMWDQDAYEERLKTEAELMIALEALREAVVELDQVTGDLEDCITDNKEGIHQAHVAIDTRLRPEAHNNHLVGEGQR